MLGNFWKSAESDATQASNQASGDAAFILSTHPLVPRESQQSSRQGPRPDYENLGELPRTYGRPVLFGIARDPQTLFVYWEINWHSAFGNKPPADRKVHLRVLANNGGEETRVAVEPLAGNHSVAVSSARSTYRIELGYDEPPGVWNLVAGSDEIATPPDDISESAEIDVATVPFHLSFQRLIDSFRASRFDEDALVDMVCRLQERADDSAETDLTHEDRELLRAIDCGLPGSDVTQRRQLRKSESVFASRERIDAVLGFGGSSRM